jgi:hypothetical protein
LSFAAHKDATKGPLLRKKNATSAFVAQKSAAKSPREGQTPRARELASVTEDEGKSKAK